MQSHYVCDTIMYYSWPLETSQTFWLHFEYLLRHPLSYTVIYVHVIRVWTPLPLLGILCGTVSSKMKKKKMYLASRNTGKSITALFSGACLHPAVWCVCAWTLCIYGQCMTIVEFDHHELQIYEEIACMPPFQRKTLVLIGAQGVGRRSLKQRLLTQHPDRYGTTVPCEYRHSNGCPIKRSARSS